MQDMELFKSRVDEAAAHVRSRLTCRPQLALVLGTGLGGVMDSMATAGSLPYTDIPHHPMSTVAGHEGRLIWGAWAGRDVIALQGRFHLYEGYSPLEISFPFRLLAALGVRALIVTNAAGGLNPGFSAGDLMLIRDHINLLGVNPLAGPNIDAWGVRFPDMTDPYSERLQALAADTARAAGIRLRTGVYVGVPGPSLETAAETRFLRQIGADAVGMSTVIEVITAVHAGLEVLGMSVITNVNNPDDYRPATLEHIIATARVAGPRLTRLLEAIVAHPDFLAAGVT